LITGADEVQDNGPGLGVGRQAECNHLLEILRWYRQARPDGRHERDADTVGSVLAGAE
jgi:hypothetical protein